MSFRLGGYYIEFHVVHKVMAELKIPNPLNYEDTELEFALNYWLCDTGKTNVKAAYIDWKEDGPGMLFVSSFKYIPEGMPDSGDLEESDRDRASVPEWLIKNAGLKAEEMKWITLFDDQDIMTNGLQPRKIIFEKSKKTAAEFLAELKEKGRKRQLDGVYDHII